jgi:hypothetical protein
METQEQMSSTLPAGRGKGVEKIMRSRRKWLPGFPWSLPNLYLSIRI